MLYFMLVSRKRYDGCNVGFNPSPSQFDQGPMLSVEQFVFGVPRGLLVVHRIEREIYYK